MKINIEPKKIYKKVVINLFEKEKVSIPLAPNYTAFKNWMLKK